MRIFKQLVEVVDLVGQDQMQRNLMAALAALVLQIHSPELLLLMVVAVVVQSELLLRDQPVLLQAVVAQVEKMQLEVMEVLTPVVVVVVVAQSMVNLSVAQAVLE
jgi:hypothetical protein